eukprot:scaffold655_cov105-Isochrysis_galbana.AAC.7
MKGWSHISSTRFSLTTCSTCLFRTSAPFRIPLSAYATLLVLGLCSASRTRPKEPSPRITWARKLARRVGSSEIGARERMPRLLRYSGSKPLATVPSSVRRRVTARNYYCSAWVVRWSELTPMSSSPQAILIARLASCASLRATSCSSSTLSGRPIMSSNSDLLRDIVTVSPLASTVALT